MQAPESHRKSTSPLAHTRLLLDGAELQFEPDFLTPAQADAAFAAIATEVPWTQHHVRLFGRTLAAPRLSSWHGDPAAHYRYSGTTHPPLVWTPTLVQLRDQLSAHLGCGFNSVLCNRYRNGNDSMGWHADDERELGADPIIASISLGASRRFDLKRRDRTGKTRSLELTHGALLVMAGQTQRHWLHQLPKVRHAVGERINLTYRMVGKTQCS